MKVLIFRSPGRTLDRMADDIVQPQTSKPVSASVLATSGTAAAAHAAPIKAARNGAARLSGTTPLNLNANGSIAPNRPRPCAHCVPPRILDVPGPDGAIQHLPRNDAPGSSARAKTSEARDTSAHDKDPRPGISGDISLNEPGFLASRTAIKTLIHRTEECNARFFDTGNAAQASAMTTAIATSFASQRAQHRATAPGKAKAIGDMRESPVSARALTLALQLRRDVTAARVTEPAQLPELRESPDTASPDDDGSLPATRAGALLDPASRMPLQKNGMASGVRA
ncbi:Glucosamine-6-phosphate deaminase 1 [Marinibacterium anthonyi]|nr:Glucosamine-6-phosphate deaminase 1 [Marinibacterium anthonyi]